MKNTNLKHNIHINIYIIMAAQLKSTSEFALEMQAKLSTLQAENKKLRAKLDNLEKTKTDAVLRIDNFVEEWYNENKDLVDIGEVQICGRYKVDLIPDELEKRLYAKMLKIVYAFLARGMI